MTSTSLIGPAWGSRRPRGHSTSESFIGKSAFGIFCGAIKERPSTSLYSYFRGVCSVILSLISLPAISNAGRECVSEHSVAFKWLPSGPPNHYTNVAFLLPNLPNLLIAQRTLNWGRRATFRLKFHCNPLSPPFAMGPIPVSGQLVGWPISWSGSASYSTCWSSQAEFTKSRLSRQSCFASW